MMPSRLLLGLAVGLLMLHAQPAWAEDRFEGMDDYIRQAMQKWQVPGLAIAVVKDGEIVLARGYGVCHLGQDGKVMADTVFSIASCTKSFTAASIAMLVDEGKLAWDDPVRKHLPGFKVADAYVTEHITLRDLLCHRTGLVRGDLLTMPGGLTQAEMFERLQFLGQSAPFRTKFTYNNVMFAVLGQIITQRSGQSYQTFLDTRIFQPLGMSSTMTDISNIPPDRLEMRHRFYDSDLGPLLSPLETPLNAPAGAIHSTVNDMARWLLLQLKEGEYHGQQLISKTSIREMHAFQHSIPVQWKPNADVYRAQFVGTGLGWFARDYRGRKIVQHDGAWGANMMIVPEEKLGIVVLSNRDWNSLVWMLAFDVFDSYLDGPEKTWSPGKKWDHWLPLGGPNAGDSELKLQLTKLEATKLKETQPTLPLASYAGTYSSKVYSDLKLSVVQGRLHAQFGPYSARLTHWEQNTFHGHKVIEPFFDWLVKFDLGDDKSVHGLEIIHVGWKDPDERFLFTRQSVK